MLTLILLGFLQLPAAGSAGIYLSATDFQQHRLSYIVPADQLRYDSPFRPWAVLVYRAGTQQHFLADSIYGYRRAGQDFRFLSGPNKGTARIDDNFYKIEATAPLCIYSLRHVFSATQLLCSLTPTSPVFRLDTKNLARQFPTQLEMIREIDQDKLLRFSMATRDPDGQLRVVKILAKYLPAPTK